MNLRASQRPTGESTTNAHNEKARLIKWLINEGARLGFHPEASYTSSEDGAVADAVWALNPGQKPVFTFTLAEDISELMASVLQWAGSSTEPKSWMHICVVTGRVEMPPLLPVGVKVYNAENQDSLSHVLEDLTDSMVRLLRNFTDDEPEGSRYETVKRLGGIASVWPMDMWSPRLTPRVNITLGDGLNLFIAEGIEDEETDAPMLKPSRKVVPVDLICGDASFEGALMRLVEASIERLHLSTEHRNYPFIFRLTAAEHGESKIDLWFDSAKSNIPQALRFSELANALKASGSVTFSTASSVVAEGVLES